MKKSFPKILLYLILVLLLVSNIYFIHKYLEPSIQVQVGIPLFDEESNVTATIVSPFLDNKEETNLLLMAFLMGRTMDEEQFPTELAHGCIIINYEGCSYPHNMWITEDSVIFEISTESALSYREFHNDHNNVVALLNSLIDSLKKPN